jgi:hypothetical protein
MCEAIRKSLMPLRGGIGMTKGGLHPQTLPSQAAKTAVVPAGLAAVDTVLTELGPGEKNPNAEH